MLPTNVIEHWLNNTNANWIKVLRNHKNLKKIDKNHKQVLVCYEKKKKEKWLWINELKFINPNYKNVHIWGKS